MRYLKTVPLVLVFLSFLVLPSVSFPEVKISLKNGREIIADSCSETKDKLICEMMGGQFEIDKRDVGNLKEITVKKREITPESEGGAAGEKNSGEATGADKKAGYQKRLDEINQRKRELVSVREGLKQERDTLNAEFLRQGDMLRPEVFDSFQKRFNEIDAKINSFNQENSKLNEEADAILKEMGQSTEGMK